MYLLIVEFTIKSGVRDT